MSRRSKIRMQRCFNCDAQIGIYSDADYDDFDNCGKVECRREASIELREREYERRDWECA
jgi:hypothetical protein